MKFFSIALLSVAGILVPLALWTSLFGGYGDTTGTAIGLWVAIVLLSSIAAVSGLIDRRDATEPRPSVVTIVAGAGLLSLAPLEGLVLLANLSGGHLQLPLTVTLVALVALGALFLWLGIRRR